MRARRTAGSCRQEARRKSHVTTPATPPGNDTGALPEGDNGHEPPGPIATRLRQIHEAASEFGVFTLDQAGRIVSWNRLAEKACGYGADQIVARNFSCLYTDAETADGEPSRSLARALAQGRCEEQAPRRRRDGSSFWADVTIVAVHDAAGKPLRLRLHRSRHQRSRQHGAGASITPEATRGNH
jgi:PAS domain S-box-containing protein